MSSNIHVTRAKWDRSVIEITTYLTRNGVLGARQDAEGIVADLYGERPGPDPLDPLYEGLTTPDLKISHNIHDGEIEMEDEATHESVYIEPADLALVAAYITEAHKRNETADIT